MAEEIKTPSGAIFSKNNQGETVFDLRQSRDILRDMNRAILQETKKGGSERGAVEWFSKMISEKRMLVPSKTNLTIDIMRSEERLVSKAMLERPGRMFTFFYRPKTRADLRYYDITPLIITLPIEGANPSGRILGINLHYLEPDLRGMLIDRMLMFAHSQKGEKKPPKGTGFFRANYELLQHRKYAFGIPCLRSYSPDRIIGRPVLVPANEWGNAVALPYQHMVKTTNERVWLESRKIFRKFVLGLGVGE